MIFWLRFQNNKCFLPHPTPRAPSHAQRAFVYGAWDATDVRPQEQGQRRGRFALPHGARAPPAGRFGLTAPRRTQCLCVGFVSGFVDCDIFFVLFVFRNRHRSPSSYSFPVLSPRDTEAFCIVDIGAGAVVDCLSFTKAHNIWRVIYVFVGAWYFDCSES